MAEALFRAVNAGAYKKSVTKMIDFCRECIHAFRQRAALHRLRLQKEQIATGA